MENVKVNVRGKEKQIIFDTDMGVDDARALAVLLQNTSKTNVVAITLCCSHADMNTTAMNAMRVLKEWNKLDIPVFKTNENAFGGDKIQFSTEFGKDGFGDAFGNDKQTVSQKFAQKEDAVKLVLDLAKKYPEKLTYLMTGPVTNLANAIKQDPYTIFCLKEIIITGSCNTGLEAQEESNFYADPEAIDYVLKSKIPFTFISKEITEFKFTLEWYDKWIGQETKKAQFLKKIGVGNRSKLTTDMTLTSEIAAAICVDPDIITDTEKIKAFVELDTDHSGHLELLEEEEENCDINNISKIDTNRVIAVLETIVKN